MRRAVGAYSGLKVILIVRTKAGDAAFVHD